MKLPFRVDKNHTSSVSGGLTMARRVETSAMTTSRAEFGQLALDAHSLMGGAFATEEVVRDSIGVFTRILARGFEAAKAATLIDERINGSGIGEFLGVLNSGALITVAAEGSQTADTLKFANLANMRSRCWGYDNALWLFNHDVYPEIIAAVSGDGSRAWSPGDDEIPDRILGRPALPCEYCQTLGDAGDILLVNWSEYLEGTYTPMQSASSVHVRFVEHERLFKFWIRNAGAPWWASALTPTKASTTLSPFVTLAARA